MFDFFLPRTKNKNSKSYGLYVKKNCYLYNTFVPKVQRKMFLVKTFTRTVFEIFGFFNEKLNYLVTFHLIKPSTLYLLSNKYFV